MAKKKIETAEVAGPTVEAPSNTHVVDGRVEVDSLYKNTGVIQ